MDKVYIHTEYIKLQQVLKLAGLIDQGSDVKVFLADGVVYVNGVMAKKSTPVMWWKSKEGAK